MSATTGRGPEEPFVRVVLLCSESHQHWYDGVDAARCTSADHRHQRIEVHVHRAPVRLPDGTEIAAVSFDPADPYARANPPDYGVYFDERWAPDWAHEHVPWPDFGVPSDAGQLLTVLAAALDRALAGERVEIGCIGGHGRTGTALACLAVLAGLPAREAAGWVREHYCTAAIETAEQEEFVRSLTL
jgi:hypothetical protein